MNKDFASPKFEDGLKMLADGKGAHYPMLTCARRRRIAANNPDKVKDVGFFALPGDDAAKNGLTVWAPGGVYIPKTTTGAKLDAAKKFLAFVASPEGCDSHGQGRARRAARSWSRAATLPADVPQAVKDMQPYFDTGAHRAWRWSSSPRSRARRWSRSPSRSARASARRPGRRRALRPGRRRSRPSSSGSPGW